MNKKNYNVAPELKNGMDKFASEMNAGLRRIKVAAEQFAQDLATYPESADIAYAERFPMFQQKDWSLLAKIGRGELTPRIFYIQNDYTIMATERLPIHVQEALIGTENTPPQPQVVFSRGRLQEKTLAEMNSVEVTALVDMKAGRIRSGEEQMAAAAEKAKPRAQFDAWKIVNGTLCVYTRTNFSIEEVAEILRQMKKGAR